MIKSDTPVAYVNGAYVAENEASISIFDRGFRQSDAVFDTARTIGHRPYKLREHLQRLWRSLDYARIDPGLSMNAIEEITLAVVAHNAKFLAPNDDVWVRQYITRGLVKRVGAETSSGATIVVSTERLPFEAMARGYCRGVSVWVPTVRSLPTSSIDPRMKTTSRMTNNLAEQEVAAIDPRAYPLLLDPDDAVSESTGANFFAVLEGGLVTAGDLEVLNGISRATIVDIARGLGLACRTARLSLPDLAGATEAFLTGTSFCILPVCSLNRNELSGGAPGHVTKRLIEAWTDATGHDFVAQALSHIDPAERVGLMNGTGP